MEDDSEGSLWSSPSVTEPRVSSEGHQTSSTDCRSTLEYLLEDVYRAPETLWGSSPGNLSQAGEWAEPFSGPELSNPFLSTTLAPGSETFPVPERGPASEDSAAAISRAFPGQPIVINHYHYYRAFDRGHGHRPSSSPGLGETVDEQGPMTPPTPHPVLSFNPGFLSPVSGPPSPNEGGFGRGQRSARLPAYPVSHTKPMVLYPAPQTAAHYPNHPPNHAVTASDQQLTQSCNQPSRPHPSGRKRPGNEQAEPRKKRARKGGSLQSEPPGQEDPPGQHNEFPYGKRPEQTAALEALENSWLGQFANPASRLSVSASDEVSVQTGGVSQGGVSQGRVGQSGLVAQEPSVEASQAPRLSNFLQNALNRFVADTASSD